jgi:alpha/beta superfamily hydrolase
VHVFQFGSSDHRLLGVYEPAAAAGTAPAKGAVLCQPIGHEYIRSHRAMRKLAASLSAAGVHVLRFDYYGCGDSGGAGEDGGLQHWQSDVGAAIDELKDMAGLPRVSVVGLRFGATLAALATRTRSDVNTLILCDPVLRGDAYVAHVTDLERQWRGARPYLRRQSSTEGRELLGFPLTPEMHAEFNAVDLLAVERWSAQRVVTIGSAGTNTTELDTHLARCGVACENHQVATACAWDRHESVHLGLLANEIAQRVVARLAVGAAA